jgi:hypothetical protein
MLATIVAVIGTLLGGVVAGGLQHLTSTRTTEAAKAERRRQAVADAIPALLAALVRHREQQYLKHVARREQQPDTAEARTARYAARSAVTSAMDTLHMATDDTRLIALAQSAVDAAMALGDATPDHLDTAGLHARQAHTALRETGARHIHNR